MKCWLWKYISTEQVEGSNDIDNKDKNWKKVKYLKV